MGFSAHRRHDEGFERSIEVMTFPVAFEIMDSNPFSCPAFRESVSPKPILYIVFQPVFGHAFGLQSGKNALIGPCPCVGRAVSGRLWPRTVRFGFLL